MGKTYEEFAVRCEADGSSEVEPVVHRATMHHYCETDGIGYETPHNLSPLELVLHAPDGFIPLWGQGVHLRWRFNEMSMRQFRDPDAAKSSVRNLMAEALQKWDDAVPVRFQENSNTWDFEVVVRNADNCSAAGCTLASAFFPDSGRHQLVIYPKMFTQDRKEQVETLIHEFGHVFGLRHFFAKVREKAWPSEIFGEHAEFSIMNYGEKSVLTDADKRDLRRLYRSAWSGALTEINGTPIRFVRPYHEVGGS